MEETFVDVRLLIEEEINAMEAYCYWMERQLCETLRKLKKKGPLGREFYILKKAQKKYNKQQKLCNMELYYREIGIMSRALELGKINY